MLLTLEVISPNGEVLGPNRRKTVGPEGAQIGRSRDNDWVLNDQYISRLHARVRYVNGAFYVEGLGRNPLAINDAANAIGNNDPQLLRNGDRIFLDQYEIEVSLSSGPPPAVSAPAAALVPDDPFASEQATSPPTSAGAVPEGWGGAGPLQDIAIHDAAGSGDGNLDPLAALGGPTPRGAPPPKHVELEQRSVLEDSFRAPPPVASSPGAPGASGAIPDAWDRTRFEQAAASQPAARAPNTANPPSAANPKRGGTAAAGGSIPDAWDRSGLTQMEQPPPPPRRPAPPAQEVPPPAKQAEPPPKTVRRSISPAPQPPPTAAVAPAAPPETPARSPVSPSHVSPPHISPSHISPSGDASLSLEQMLRAAGVPAAQMSPELAAELGEVLRIVVQGLMEVLQSRAEIKSQLRMSMTRMQPTENNPLKFSPNVEAALHTLLVERNRGYLTTTRSFQEALEDIRNHQIAVLQGIRVAFDAMLENFDPKRLEEDMDRHPKRGGLLNVGAKSRFRDFYVEQFERWTSDPDETFRRLFGEDFAQAYEEQMDRLKAAGRTSGG